MSRVPRLVVMMITVFLKSTTRPWASVRRPSSRICSSELKMSACAFSTSSNSTTENGRRRTFSRSEEHTSELQSRGHLVCRLLLEKKKRKQAVTPHGELRRAELLRCHESVRG